MAINPIGGTGGGFNPERRKTPEERAAEIAGNLRERVRQLQAQFKQRMRKKAGQTPPGKSPDTGTVFDSAALPEHEQNPPAPKEESNDDGVNEVG